jgi:hypothetical protein
MLTNKKRAIALVGAAVGVLILTAYLPVVAAALNLAALAWLIWMRLENLIAVRSMRNGKLPAFVNGKLPLLAATLAAAWLLGASALSYLGGAYSLNLEELLLGEVFGSEAIGFLLGAAFMAASASAPFVILAAHEAIYWERTPWKNSGPPSDPPAPTFGPFPPTGLLPAPLAASAEPAFSLA